MVMGPGGLFSTQAQGPVGPPGPAGPSGSPGFVNAATPAALGAAAAGLLDGQPGYVIAPTLRWYKLSRSDTQVPNGQSIVAAAGGGNWLVEPTVGDSSWLRQTAWGINPSTGSDSNVGSVASPLATFGEWMRRLSIMSIITPALLSMSVTIVGDLPTTDPINAEFWLGPATEIDIIFTPTIQGVASTFTSVTAKNRTAPGTQWSVGDATAPFAGTAGFMIKDSTAPATAWIDVVSDPTSAAITEPMVPAATGGSPVTALALRAITNGDAYTIQRPAQATFVSLRVHGAALSTQFPSLRFFGMWSVTAPTLPTITTDGCVYLLFNECRFDNAPQIAGLDGSFAPIKFQNCYAAGGSQSSGISQINFFGGVSKAAHFFNGAGVLGVWDGDHILRAIVQPANGATAQFGNVASLNQARVFGCQGPSVRVRHAVGFYGSSIMWGNPTNYGLAGQGSGGLRVFYPNGSIATVFGQLPQTGTLSFPPPTTTQAPVYNPAIAVWAVAPAAGMTLANLAATIAGGGYGGSAFDPVTASSFGPH
jgi:hypothetical protein